MPHSAVVTPARGRNEKSQQIESVLLRLEDVIETAERWHAEAAKALVQIRDQRLFRRYHKSFDSYVRNRWGWERSRAYQMCQFGELLLRLSTKVESLPRREAHARPLYPLNEADQIRVWRRVLTDMGQRPTAAKIEEIAADFKPRFSRSHRSVIPYCGSKSSLVPHILSEFSDHQIYVETHAGSAIALLSKQPSRIEVLNDRDDAVVNFFQVLRERQDELVGLLKLTPFALSEWQRCRVSLADDSVSAVERARRFYVSVCQSFAGFGAKFNRSINKPHASYWRDRIERLYQVAMRLGSVVIEALDAVDCIRKYDTPKTLFFVDPPYTQSARSRVGPKYRVDMADADHLRLIDAITRAKGRVLVASGDSDMYSRKLRDWRICFRHRVPCGSGGSKVGRYATPYRTETLWANFR